jgi:SAM-dependent methyltransferase
MNNIISFLLDSISSPFVKLHYKTRNYRIYLKSRLPNSARVLEIGPGHNPWFRSDVLCEKFLNDNTERSGDLVRDGRPLVNADACNMPFDNKSFDFVFCSHVMEHVEDLEGFLKEIQRVGKAGYLETPNYLFEQTVGTTTHKWAFWIENEVLHAEPKWVPGAPARAYHGMHRAIGNHSFLSLAYILTPETRVMSLYWKDKINYIIHDKPVPTQETRASDDS